MQRVQQPPKVRSSGADGYSVRSLAYCSSVESSGFGAVAADVAGGSNDRTHRFKVTCLHGLHCHPSETVEKRARKALAATAFAHGVLGSKDTECRRAAEHLRRTAAKSAPACQQVKRMPRQPAGGLICPYTLCRQCGSRSHRLRIYYLIPYCIIIDRDEAQLNRAARQLERTVSNSGTYTSRR